MNVLEALNHITRASDRGDSIFCKVCQNTYYVCAAMLYVYRKWGAICAIGLDPCHGTVACRARRRGADQVCYVVRLFAL